MTTHTTEPTTMWTKTGPQCIYCGEYHYPQSTKNYLDKIPMGSSLFVVLSNWGNNKHLCLKNPTDLKIARRIVSIIEETFADTSGSYDSTYSWEGLNTIFLNSPSFKMRSGSTFRTDEGGMEAFRIALNELRARVGPGDCTTIGTGDVVDTNDSMI